MGAGVDCIGSATETQLCSGVYGDCEAHFGYQFEQLSDACNVCDQTQDMSIDSCIEYCQDDIECVGVAYEDDTCKSFVGE